MAKARTGRATPANGARPSDALSRERKLELYYWMKLTRQLEERLVNLYRQTKVVGGLFRSLGQEADAVGSCFALEQRDVMSPLIRNLGAMLVKGATPVEVLKQYMAKADSPTRGRELNIHFGDIGAAGVTRGFLGQISPLGDMVPVMTGVTMSFKMRGEDRVGLVYVGDGATSTGAFHEGINFAAVQKCPLVVIVENNGYAYSTPTHKQTAARFFVDKAIGYGVLGLQADGNDVLATYDVTKTAVDHARAGNGVALVELITYRRKGHAEHDNQSYVPAGEIEKWAEENDPIDRYVRVLLDEWGATDSELAAIDARILREIDEATDLAELSGTPDAREALLGVYAEPPAEQPLWFRRDVDAESLAYGQERPESWGTWSADGAKRA
ncbi:thiamine pyrophosphate-dependent dehydrogenase E1 component subunit alpha [Gemmatimonas groenlandica]|uniref:2-oxoisovalerate dehydrogenase subunit alpha n=1 Tax=Gemmatimonas groenlandica TaxID=2732249 RepID=A0A6M4IJK0_9BACT|nr:thiamine pyrophosphate-dependent dehydrogenase E1 component subunit alpha [Gemmatimonas groenlandica]QJR34800.1 thiamine pyrophosphate-dependent dehydrogenase E1 component subunit alpha [Gemmatimonas groenlandica]